METSLLKTKLNIPPPRPHLVARPRLIQRLEEAFSYSLVLVSAPAGFGKTTLLSQWIRGSQPPIKAAWFSLDKGDNDPTRFWRYFTAALESVQPGCGKNILPLWHSPQPTPAETILTALINDLSALNSDYMVVLDDYHLVESREIHESLDYLLEHIPERMHLILATRADPPLPLARFRGKEMVLDLRADDLRFSGKEALALLENLKSPNLSLDQVGALIERTDGWAVGLKMAALSLRSQKDIAGFLASFTGSQRYVTDYLMEEVFLRRPEEVREFLLQTSILNRFSAPLCDSVTGKKDGTEMLGLLERDHLFTVPLDESRQWYRYEHLFADLLRNQLERNHGAEHVRELQRRASRWFEENGLLEDAVNYAAAAQDWERAVLLMGDLSKKLRLAGEFKTLDNLFAMIPEAFLREHPALYNQYAATLSAVGKFDAAESALKYLEVSTQADSALQSDVAFSLAAIARFRGDLKSFIHFSEKALLLAPTSDIGMRCKASFNLACGLFEANLFKDLETRLNEAYDLALQAGEIWFAAVALNILGARLHQKGELERAIMVYRKAIGASWNLSVAMTPLIKLSRALYETNDLQGATENLQRSLIRSKSSGIMDGAPMRPFFQSLISLAKCDEANATAFLEEMDKVCQHPTVSPPYRANQPVAHVLIAIRLNDLKTASTWGRKLSEQRDVLQLEFQHVPARLLIAQGRKEEAVELLRELHHKMIQLEAHGLAINVRVYQALAASTQEQALRFLADALVEGEKRGYIRTFVDEGELLKPLLEKALTQGITPEYTKKLLTIIEDEWRIKQKASGKIILTDRELEILRLLEAEISNQEIADRLIVSLSTIKTHVYHIFEKLNAKDRSQAIYQARELKLL